ncbi:MAG: hypothetical protein QXO51_04095 [Halobacteria archaeon]
MRATLDAERLEIPAPAPVAEAVASRLREQGWRVVETASGEFPAAFREATGREPPDVPGRPPLFAILGNRALFAAPLWEGEGLRLDTLRFAADHPELPVKAFFVALGSGALRAEMEANPGALQVLQRIREAGGLMAVPRDAAGAKWVEFLQARGLVFQKGGHAYLTAEGNALVRKK